MNPSQTPESLVGTLFAGRFRIERLLGAGGMGTVFLVHHEVLDRHFALKLLSSSTAFSTATLAGRFRREARAAARIECENVVSIFDFGQSEDGMPYLVMEHVEGVNLEQALTGGRAFPVPRVLDILTQVARALAAAHGQQVIHRDLKPGNVMLTTRRGRGDFVKVLDFGMAKIAGVGSGTGVSIRGQTIGTPEYISPEQIADETVDHRADLYSFGALAFELVAGRPPFRGNLMKLLQAHMRDVPPSPSRVTGRADVPPELDQLILRCLAKKPDDRFASAGEVEARLAALADLVAGAAAAPLEIGRTLPTGFEVPALSSRPVRELAYAIRDRLLGTVSVSELLAQLVIVEDRQEELGRTLQKLDADGEEAETVGRYREAKLHTLLSQLEHERSLLLAAAEDDTTATIPVGTGSGLEDVWASVQRLDGVVKKVSGWLEQLAALRRSRQLELEQRRAREEEARTKLEQVAHEVSDRLRRLMIALYQRTDVQSDPELVALFAAADIGGER